MNRKSLAIALAAGAVCSVSAFAAEPDFFLPTQFSEVKMGGAPAYGDRAVITVVDNFTGTFNSSCYFGLGATSHVVDDVSFAPGPWGATINNEIRTVAFGVSGGSAGRPAQVVVRMNFYDTVNYTAADMLAGSVLLDTVDFLVNTPPVGFVSQFTALDFGVGNGILVPGNSVAVEIDLRTADNSARLTVTGGITLTGASKPYSPGSSGPSWGRDRNNDGVFVGSALPVAPPGEHNQTNTGASCGFIHSPHVFTGEAVCNPATLGATVLAVTDAGSTTAAAVPANGVRWYSLTLANGATDSLRRFLDLTTDGTAALPNAALGLYDSNGILVGKDDDSGDTDNALLTFGVGRRAAVGDGIQKDGRTGELPAGTYYLAVTNGGAGALFGDCFSVSTIGAAATITLNLATNVNGGALAPAVAPTILSGFDLGPILENVGGSAAARLSGTEGILWSTFEVTDLGCADGTSAFLDFDFAATSSSIADIQAFIFDATGVLVASDTVFSGPDELAQISLGNSGTPRTYGANTENFAGENGAYLTPGLYYIGSGLVSTTALTLGDRWHLRSDSGSNLDIGIDIYAGCAAVGGGSNCGSTDFDGDGDSGTDADIEAFFAVIGGQACPTGTCGSTDFDGDGDEGTDADIEAFFIVLGGGACPTD